MPLNIQTQVNFCNEGDYFSSPFSTVYDKYRITSKATEAMDTAGKLKLHRSMRRFISIYFDYSIWIPLWGTVERNKSNLCFDLDTFFRTREVVLDVANVMHVKTHNGHSWDTYSLYNRDLHEYLISHPWEQQAGTVRDPTFVDSNVKPVTIRLLRIESRPPPRPEEPLRFGCRVFYSVDGPGDVNYKTGEDWFPIDSYEIPEDVLEREIKK